MKLFLNFLCAISLFTFIACQEEKSKKKSNRKNDTSDSPKIEKKVQAPNQSTKEEEDYPLPPTYDSSTTDYLVKQIIYDKINHDLLTNEEKSLLEKDYFECGINQALVFTLSPLCNEKIFLESRDILYLYPSKNKGIEAKVLRFKKTSSTIFVFKFDNTEDDNTVSSRFLLFSVDSNQELYEIINKAKKDIQGKDLSESSSINTLEQILGINYVGELVLWDFLQEADFLIQYEDIATPRSFFHWSEFAFQKDFISKEFQEYYLTTVDQLFTIASVAYQDLYIEQLVKFKESESWIDKQAIIMKLEAMYSSETNKIIQGKIATILLHHHPIEQATQDQLDSALSLLKTAKEQVWIERGMLLFSKYKNQFGDIADLIKFAQYNNSFVRKEVAKTLPYYDDDLAREWLLKLVMDNDSFVRREALNSIRKSSFDGSNIFILDLIKSNDWRAKKSLAEALKHVSGHSSAVALLKLSADKDTDVQAAATESMKNRNLNLDDYDISTFINSNSWQSRKGLARSLQFAKGEGVQKAILMLNADTDTDVQAAALKSIQANPIESTKVNILELINKNSWQSRKGLAKALKYVSGKKSFIALLRLNGDKDADVQVSAYASIKNKSFNLASYKVSNFINKNSWKARKGLAKALQFASGNGANTALLKLNADTDNDVLLAAYNSIKTKRFDGEKIAIKSMINLNSWKARKGLAKALEFVTGQNSIKTLVSLLGDSDSDVANAAKNSLKKHGY
ncbi:hypothetical protein N9N67_06705 [Bacteriovoracaceae bacterium]|nr:hypothetical protein [Bacteriovoracaceae bacterium]